MFFLRKSLGFLAVLAVLPAAWAATPTPTARPSVIAMAGSRMPTMSIRPNLGTTNTGGNTSSLTMADKECIDAYTDCAKGADVCGTNFEECTNKTLFYGKKPQCSSVLMQCKGTAINSLFGTSTETALANKDSNGEYIYPTNGSILGQLIEAAHVNNRYDTSQCVKRYSACLKKDDVCGADFELCTSNTEFKKQKLFCESTLARCQDAGIKELWGTTNTSGNPTSDSRIGIMITEGGQLAAVNSVATCYKVADQCILNTCAQNPYKCKEGSNQELVKIVETINNPDGTSATTSKEVSLGAVNRNEISGFIKSNCADTIGGNKFCYATFIGNGAMPSAAQLKDEDNKEEVFAEAYSSRMNASMKTKIDDLITVFDKKTKKRCSDTITSCAMRNCGGGSGAACYTAAYASGDPKGVTNPQTYDDIKYGCEAVVNTDDTCRYAGATFQKTTGVLDFLSGSLFDELFTDPNNVDVSDPDPVGAVAALNAKLATSYNTAALDAMKKQCQRVATGCVKSMCGEDYSSCYRNRTDVYSTLTKSGSDAFNASMNKVGGVLDHTIILGLCMNTVKNNPTCEEHIKSEAALRKANMTNDNTWGSGTIRESWLDAGAINVTETNRIQAEDADGNYLCTVTEGNDTEFGRCDDPSGRYVYNKMVPKSTYDMEKTERNVFANLIYDLEIEAQAKYNAKLTKQQNMCLAGNTGGGIMSAGDTGSTFMWAKLKMGKVPKGYASAGLKDNQFVASNELYGSFCRIRVTLQSDDKYIQDAINAGKDWGTAYFAAGDAFTCGSWIPNSALEEISNVVGGKARAEEKRGDSRNRTWATIAGIVGGGVGGGFAGDALQKAGGLGGLLGTKKANTKKETADAVTCQNQVQAFRKAGLEDAKSYATNAISSAKKIQTIDQSVVKKAEDSVNVAFGTFTDDKNDKGVVTKSAISKQADAIEKASAAMDELEKACKATPQVADKKETGKAKGAIIGAATGSIIGGGLAWYASKSIQDAAADNAAAQAREEWMDEVGKHIRCYIGSDEVGMYSDIISTEME